MWKQYSFTDENISKIREIYATNSSDDNFLYKSFVKHNSTRENDIQSENKAVEEDIKSFIKFHPVNIEKPNKDTKQSQVKTLQEENSNYQSDQSFDKIKLYELKEWLSLQNDNVQNDTNLRLLGEVFSNINPKHIPDVCEYLELDKLNETNFHSCFCKLILHLTPQISFFTEVALIKHLLYSKVICLDNQPSRLLILTVLEWAKISPKAVLEGLFIPCIQNNYLGKVQVDFMVRIIKESLPLDQADIYLREFLHTTSKIEESHIIIIQALTEKKTNFEAALDLLFDKLLEAANYHKQNLAFIKLLLTILTKLEQQIKPVHLSTIDKIIKINETFLKKSAEKIFTKLQEKYLPNENSKLYEKKFNKIEHL
ncbi:Fanconi anemia group E protein-like [Centruroides vittatus]|uniref:Fanconi anemia group E protein-like n=1 Tax=Centruroides vittatus TaxID=120091 RepID=UPI003510CB38